MDLDLYYFDVETSEIKVKKCKYIYNNIEISDSGKTFDFDMEKIMIQMLEDLYKNMNIFSSEIFSNCKEENILYFKDRYTCEIFIPFLKRKEKILLPKDIVNKICLNLDSLSNQLDIIEYNMEDFKDLETRVVKNVKRLRRSNSLSNYLSRESYNVLDKYVKLVELKKLISLVTCDFYEDLIDRINNLMKLKLDIILGNCKRDLFLKKIIELLSCDINDIFCNINYIGNLKEYSLENTDEKYLDRIIAVIMDEGDFVKTP